MLRRWNAPRRAPRGLVSGAHRFRSRESVRARRGRSGLSVALRRGCLCELGEQLLASALHAAAGRGVGRLARRLLSCCGGRADRPARSPLPRALALLPRLALHLSPSRTSPSRTVSSRRAPQRSTTGHFVRLIVIITEKSVYSFT